MIRYCGRVVKAMDLKSIGFSRTGSNPVNVVFLIKLINLSVTEMTVYAFNKIVY